MSKQRIEDAPINFAEEIIADVKNTKDGAVLKCEYILQDKHRLNAFQQQLPYYTC